MSPETALNQYLREQGRISAEHDAAEARFDFVLSTLLAGRRVWVNGGQSGYCYGIDDLLAEQNWEADITALVSERRTISGDWHHPLAKFHGLTLGGLVRATLRDAKPGTAEHQEQIHAANRLREVSHILAYWWAWDNADDCEVPA